MSTEKEELKNNSDGAVKSRYDNLSNEREHYWNRARDNSEVTIPYLVPRAGSNFSSEFDTPYQSVGARGINNLASKMVLAFLPPNLSIFAFEISESVLKELESQQQDGEAALTLGALEKPLRSLERDVLKEISASNIRTTLFEGFKHLFVAGNILLHAPEKTNNIKLFRLDRFVCVRDYLGNPIEIITKEELSPLTISKKVKEICNIVDDPKEEKNIPLYTKIYFDEDIDKWEVYQECNGKIIPDSYGTYPKDKLPWIALRGIAVDGENYGRSYVEEYYGDLRSLEGLQKNIVECVAAMSKAVWMVDPNSTTKKEVLAKAKNNAIVSGKATDVTVLTSQKQADLNVAMQVAKSIEDRLAYAFMLNTAIQRGGERVTAEEIKYMSKELEDALGGLFTTWTNELMIPLLHIILNRMEKAGKIPQFPKGLVKPMLTTGLESIGRTNDLQNLQMFVQSLAQINASSYLNNDELIKRIGNTLNIQMDGLVKTKEEIQQEQQQAQQAQMMQSLGPNAINQMGGIAKQQLEAQGQQDQQEQGTNNG